MRKFGKHAGGGTVHVQEKAISLRYERTEKKGDCRRSRIRRWTSVIGRADGWTGTRSRNYANGCKPIGAAHGWACPLLLAPADRGCGGAATHRQSDGTAPIGRTVKSVHAASGSCSARGTTGQRAKTIDSGPDFGNYRPIRVCLRIMRSRWYDFDEPNDLVEDDHDEHQAAVLGILHVERNPLARRRVANRPR